VGYVYADKTARHIQGYVYADKTARHIQGYVSFQDVREGREHTTEHLGGYVWGCAVSKQHTTFGDMFPSRICAMAVSTGSEILKRRANEMTTAAVGTPSATCTTRQCQALLHANETFKCTAKRQSCCQMGMLHMPGTMQGGCTLPTS